MIDRYEAIALGVFALGVGIFVAIVIPHIDLAIAVFDHALFWGVR
jgi:hypothetical protein